jgi:MmyB-like transcription regulator ligand binding domain
VITGPGPPPVRCGTGAASWARSCAPAWTALPARLAQLSPDFARFWASSDVAGPERRLKRFRHPSAGQLTLHSTSLLMADDPMIRIVILYPATASDAARLERLAR